MIAVRYKYIDQCVLQPVMLVRNERDGVQVSIRVQAATQIKYVRPHGRPCKIADSCKVDIDICQYGHDLLVHVRDGFEVFCGLHDLAGPHGLRDFLQKGEPISNRPVFLHEQLVQDLPNFCCHVRLHRPHKIILVSFQPDPNQVGQSSSARDLNPLFGQEVDTAPKDETRLEIPPRHRRYFRDHLGLRLIIKRSKSLQLEDAPLMRPSGPPLVILS